MTKSMDLVNYSQKNPSTQDFSNITKNMVSDLRNTNQVIATKDSSKKIKRMGKGNSNGTMDNDT